MPLERGKPRLGCEACNDWVEIDEISHETIGTRCRVCSEVVFTEADWRAWRRMQLWARISAFLGRIPLFRARIYRVRVSAGKLEVK